MMNLIEAINNVIWAEPVLYAVLATGVLFTIWSGFCQYRALTHGMQVTRGVYDDPNDPGAINHFQALSAALSATVGLGNIAGVGVAVALGGPGAVFWMWVVGGVGMALKTTEVTLAMLYRNTARRCVRRNRRIGPIATPTRKVLRKRLSRRSNRAGIFSERTWAGLNFAWSCWR